MEQGRLTGEKRQCATSERPILTQRRAQGFSFRQDDTYAHIVFARYLQQLLPVQLPGDRSCRPFQIGDKSLEEEDEEGHLISCDELTWHAHRRATAEPFRAADLLDSV